MWSLLKWLATRLAVVRWVFKSIGGLAVLIPLALLLKTIGLPILIILGVLAFPVLVVLFIFGLPIFLVFLVGGAVLAFLAMLLTLGLFALKIAVVVVLPVVLVWKLFAWLFRPSDHGSDRVEGGGVDPA